MQTSVPKTPEPDMFPDAAPTCQRLEFFGILKADAQLRSKPIGDAQHIMPVLCLDLTTLEAGALMHAEQIYTEATRKQAEHLASTLKKGDRVRLTTSLLDLRLFLPHVEHIALDNIQPH